MHLIIQYMLKALLKNHANNIESGLISHCKESITSLKSTQRVTVKGSVSGCSLVMSGYPKESVLGQILFISSSSVT